MQQMAINQCVDAMINEQKEQTCNAMMNDKIVERNEDIIRLQSHMRIDSACLPKTVDRRR